MLFLTFKSLEWSLLLSIGIHRRKMTLLKQTKGVEMMDAVIEEQEAKRMIAV